MLPDLSIFAARVADYIAICASDFSSEHRSHPEFQSHADIEFNGMALMLFTLQFNHNRAYRKLCESRNITPANVSRWTQIPAVPTTAFKEFELTSLAADQRTHVFHSSGTTGQTPSRHFHSAESLEIYEVSLLSWFRNQMLSQNNLAILTPPPVAVPNSSLVHMFETIRRNFDAPERSFFGAIAEDLSWVLNFEATCAALERTIHAEQPVLMLGTAFSFVHLLDHLAEKNLRLKLPAGSRAMETGGYKNRSRVLSKSELHAFVTERLDIPASHILCEYGMSELSSQAYDVSDIHSSFAIRHFHFPPWARAQIISPETGREVRDGETGLLRIFDLANVFSVLAIQTEDLAIRRGNGFELIGRAEQAEPRGCSLMTA